MHKVVGSSPIIHCLQIEEQVIHIDSNWFSAERDVKRTKGLHLSHIIDFIEGRKRDVGGLSQIGHGYAAAGFLWERLLVNLIERNPWEMWEWFWGRTFSEPENPKVVRPGEQSMDGGPCPVCDGKGTLLNPIRICGSCDGVGRIIIYLTPDGYNIDDMALEEWKYTTKSARNDITSEKFSRWLNYQIPAYLKSLNLRQCRLRVYFARGDYTTGAPIWKEFVLTYTWQEIDETWDTIVNNAQALMKSLLT